MRVPKSVKSYKKKKKKEKKHKPLYVGYMYLSPWKFFRNQILLDYLGRWRNQSCQIFFQSVHPGVSGKGSNFAIFSANRRWPLQLLYYRTTVIIITDQPSNIRDVRVIDSGLMSDHSFLHQSTSPHRPTSNPGFVSHHCSSKFSPVKDADSLADQIDPYLNTCVKHIWIRREF